MVGNPVQRRGAEHRVERRAERQRGAVGVDEEDRRCFLSVRNGRPCHRQHRSRPVEPDDRRRPTGRRALNLLGQPPGATAEIEDPLPGHRLQTRDDPLAPVELRLRHTVITRGIPISHCRFVPLVRWPAAPWRRRVPGLPPEPWRRRVAEFRLNFQCSPIDGMTVSFARTCDSRLPRLQQEGQEIGRKGDQEKGNQFSSWLPASAGRSSARIEASARRRA